MSKRFVSLTDIVLRHSNRVSKAQMRKRVKAAHPAAKKILGGHNKFT